MHMPWFNEHNTAINAILAYVPLIATIVTTVLSLVLARATLRYAESSDKSLQLAREEFEREWSPELHVKLERVNAQQARIVVTNLAKISVLLQIVQLRRPSLGVPSFRSFLNEPLVGGSTWNHDLGHNLFACTGDDYEGQVAACMTFYASGRLFRTDWFRFQIQVSRGEILRLDPVNIAARRVRALGGKAQQELVKDIVEAAAATSN